MIDFYTFADSITYFVPAINLIGGVWGLLNYKKLNKPFKFLSLFFILCFFNDVFSRIVGFYFNNNLFFFSTYSILELVFIYLFLDSLKSLKHNYFKILFYFFLTFNFYEILTTNYTDLKNFQVYSRTINSFFLFLASASILLTKIKADKIEKLNTSLFAIICFFVLSMVFSLPINFLINYDEIGVFYVWFAYCINAILFFSILTFQLWKYGKIQRI